MTIAPELPGAPELIAYAASLGARTSMGHSNADGRQARQAIAAGVCGTTHTFNAMRPLDHRDSGILSVALSTDDLFAEIICDGIHVDPAIVKLFWRAKGAEFSVLVTDATSATGMPDGAYMLGGLRVEVADGKCMQGGVLAGSVLTMDRALRNMAAFSGVPLSSVLPAATGNPARMVGLDGRIGALGAGRRADIAVLSSAGEVVATLLDGHMASGSMGS
jgi:N-acetylglucosamine-6-phosphate deacetylase